LWRRKLTVFAEYDARVKAMEVDERPTETYTDIGGLDKQIEELVEAMCASSAVSRHGRANARSVLPMQQADKFKTLGITPPKGCLMYGPPGEHETRIGEGVHAEFCRYG
jgi:26S proteasome regulatory subunit T5